MVLDSDHESKVNTKFVGEGSSRRDIDTGPGFLPNRGNAMIFENFVMMFASEIRRGYQSIFGNREETSSSGYIHGGEANNVEESVRGQQMGSAQTRIWCVLLVGWHFSRVRLQFGMCLPYPRIVVRVRCGDARLLCGWMHLHSFVLSSPSLEVLKSQKKRGRNLPIGDPGNAGAQLVLGWASTRSTASTPSRWRLT